MTTKSSKRCGTVAILGETNVGKSTLLNFLVGSKISIVTHKINTTRRRVRGIVTEGPCQLIIIDTPGIFQKNNAFDKSILNSAWAATSGVDLLIVMVDAKRTLSTSFKALFNDLSPSEDSPLNKLLVINKIDKVEKSRLLSLSEELNSVIDFSSTFMISAKKGFGVKSLRNSLLQKLPEKDWIFPQNQRHSLSKELFAADCTLESLMLRIHQEIPYLVTVETNSWEELSDGSVRIGQTIYVKRDGHRGIILGPKGSTIKEISQTTRLELANFFARKVHLFIEVKLKKKSDIIEVYQEG